MADIFLFWPSIFTLYRIKLLLFLIFNSDVMLNYLYFFETFAPSSIGVNKKWELSPVYLYGGKFSSKLFVL